MKRLTLSLAAFLAVLFSLAALAQTVNCNSATGTVAIPGTALSVTCPGGGTAPPPPIVTPPPSTGCSDAQASSPIGSKTLKRQCAVSMNVLPSGASYYGAAADFGAVLGGSTWPSYNYSGYSPTFNIQSGYYLALAFTPTSPGAFQLTANQSYGNGGTIAVSTVPGAMTAGSAGFVCGVGRSAANGIYISTAGGVCGVTIGTTYYLNIADVDSAGNALCFNGRPNTCASSTISYTLYTGSGR